mmetsp:Transcript_122225/g.279922  ORF Transcript_122225/g.279922 Transcript_122225/m.279922 type:complete len:85 (+) Transcript_122225:29-283(+)
MAAIFRVHRDLSAVSAPAAGLINQLELRDLFVALLCEDGREVVLGLPTPYERERFFVCIKILRWATDSPTNTPRTQRAPVGPRP